MIPSTCPVHRSYPTDRLRASLLSAVLTTLLLTSLPAHAKRVALLVGNANYQVGRLNNPPNDVAEMEKALKALRFDVQKVLNANQNQMKRAVRDFGSAAQGAEVAFLYYSGHGTQANGENYLLPVGATIEKDSDYAIETIAANDVLAQIRGANPKTAILVLDACRDNPLAATTKNNTKGLGRMSAPTGSLIAFATAPGDTASDNGHYARVLAKELQKPGQELVDAFRNTAAEVRKLSAAGKVQDPRISEVSINERVYLAGQGTGPSAEDEAWATAKAANSEAAYRAYLAEYPQGRYAGAARVNLAALRPQPAPEPVRPSPSPSPSPAQARQAGSVFKDCADCPEMVVIPSGTFTMGSNDGDADEKPPHSVSIKSFAMGKYEVTLGQYAAFVSASGHNAGNSCYVLTGSKWADTKDRNWRNPGFAQTVKHPVACVNWDDAQAYVRWLNQKTGQTYRLPSEAEWEYACRAGARHTYCGSNSVDSVAVYGRKNGDKTQPVGGKQGNAWGLHDMSGNVWEWVQDCWHDNYSGAPNDGSAWTSGNCGLRVLRGGSWNDFASDSRAASRNRDDTTVRSYYNGFRLARIAP